MIVRSLRWRLLLAVVLIVVAVIAVAGMLSSFTVRRELDRFLVAQRRLDRDAALDRIRAAGRAGLMDALRGIHEQFGTRAIVVGEGPMVCYPPDLARYEMRFVRGGVDLSYAEGGRTETLQVRGGAYPIAGVGTVYLLPPDPARVEPRQTFRASVNRSFLIIVAVAVLLAIALLLTLFRRVFAPVEALTAGARALAAGRLDARVGTRGGDEIAELGEAFNTMADSLERNERVRRNMVTDIAHELRTPLTNIRVQVEAAQDGVLSADAKFLRSIEEEAATLARLVDDLQQLALADAGQLRLELVEVTVAEIVERAVSGLGERIKCDVPADLVVRADVLRMVQVVRNLVVNAMKYAASAIEITAARANDRVEIRVADDGPGVPPEHAERIFDRFHRVDESRSRTTGGAGLGLAIAKQIVELHGGRIWYERPAFVVSLRSAATKSPL